MSMDPALRIQALEAVIERQAARIAELEHALAGDFEPPVEWCLPRREAQIFSMLVKRERVTKEMLHTAFTDPSIEETDPAVWESHVSKMRRRLTPFGVQIECRRFLGYRLLNRERFRSAA